MKIRYCKSCVVPDTKPDIWFDEEGICSGCNFFSERKNIDWQDREKQLLAILDKYRVDDGSNYDCIVPVSGGKDSHYQVLKIFSFSFSLSSLLILFSSLIFVKSYPISFIVIKALADQ